MILRRFKENELGTWGELQIRDFQCFTFEPAGPDTKESGKDRRIPQGLYNIKWHNSAKYKQKLPLLFNDDVSESRAILIHAGNYADDTLGCVLVGRTMGENGVFNSREMMSQLLLRLRHLETNAKGVFVSEKLEIFNDFKGV